MVQYEAWATTIVVPNSVGSMTTKGQMKPTFRMSLMASQAGENSHANCIPYNTAVKAVGNICTL